MSAFGNELTRIMAVQEIGVHELARRSHYSAGYISNLRSGKKSPARETAADLDVLLQANGQLLATLNTQGPAMPEHLTFLDVLTNHAIELGRWAEAGSVGDGTLEQLDDAIQRIARDHLTSPLEPLIRRASDVSHHVLDLLRERQRIRHTRDLYLIGAKANAFLAGACGDLGQQAAAAAHARTALILAQESGHPGVVALGLSALSKVAFWDGQKPRAAELARRGFEMCRPTALGSSSPARRRMLQPFQKRARRSAGLPGPTTNGPATTTFRGCTAAASPAGPATR